MVFPDPSMRTIITILAILPWVVAIAQEDGAIAQVTAVEANDSGSVRTSRWSGSGGSFAVVPPADTGRAMVTRWSGTGVSFALGQPIQPISMRAITWEFGDGSLSHILPPQPWRPTDLIAEPRMTMAPFRERSGGSPCVSAAQGSIKEERSGEPRPEVVTEAGQPVLVTTGFGVRYLQVRMLDPTGRDRSAVLCQRFSSGRWALERAGDPDAPLFITLQDISTGERWRAGVDL